MFGFKSELDIFHNSKIKYYPDGTYKITVCDKPIFKESGYELSNRENNVGKKYNTSNPRSDSIHRAIQNVFDISYLNDFKYFVTLTISSDKLDRYSVSDVRTKVIKWLNNMVERYNFIYLLIPEKHKDGAIHMHMLCNGNNLKLSPAVSPDGKNIYDKHGRQIYNFTHWNFGFSQCVEIDGNREHVSKYVTKYLTKDSCKIFGKFYYSGGKDLKRDVPFVLCDVDFDSVDCKIYHSESCPYSFKYPEEII